jgi:hypothetical protein
MAWSNSKIFLAYLEDSLENTAALDANSDTFKVALYNNSITPDQTVATANTVYGSGVWTAGSSPNIEDTTGWPFVGRNLVSVASSFTSNVYTFDAQDTVSANATTTLVNAYGCLVYDDTVGDQGVCFNYFGGANSVTAGTFTIAWHTSGIFALTL